jgi:predicted Rossmann fold flavoprotein
MNERCDIAVVGAGAAGLTAAIWAASTLAENAGRRSSGRGGRGRVIVLNGSAPPAAKLRLCGGGRCNVSNRNLSARDYAGSPNIVRNILAGFSVKATIAWFQSLGVKLAEEEDGKIFPATGRAATVVEAILGRCRFLGVEIMSGCQVTNISPPRQAENGDRAIEIAFEITHRKGSMLARRVILATGGRSLPKTGSDGTGWSLARKLGHSVSSVHPALVPLTLNKHFYHAAISGLSQPVELFVQDGGKTVWRGGGEMLWTHFGISGPAVLNASRHFLAVKAKGGEAVLVCNLMGGDDTVTVDRWLIEKAHSNPNRLVANVLDDHLPQRLAELIVKHAGLDSNLKVGQMTRDNRKTLVGALCRLALPVTGHRGWDCAEVTAGGVPLDEIDYRTMASRKSAGLYLAGEMLDCDGPVGGFNLQWAWSSGKLAGVAAASAASQR